MAYPLMSDLRALNVSLDTSRQSQLLNGLTNLEQALILLDKLSGVSDKVLTNLLTREASSTPQGTWVRVVDATKLWNGSFTNAGGPAATGDNFTLDMFIPSAGTWSLTFNASKDANNGILKVFLNAVQIGVVPAGYDLYAAALAPVNMVTIAGLVLTPGRKVLTFKIDGKNGASGGFEFHTKHIALSRTA